MEVSLGALGSYSFHRFLRINSIPEAKFKPQFKVQGVNKVKITLQAVLFALLFAGILAAVSQPSHSDMMMAANDTAAPTPACSPWDSDCDPGPAFNAPQEVPVGEGPGPIPACSPWNSSCNPGPQFPKRNSAQAPTNSKSKPA